MHPVKASPTTSRTGNRPVKAIRTPRPAFSRAPDFGELSRAAAPDARNGLAHQASCPAFTIVELLVVVAIVAILASLLVPVLLAARTTARKKQALKEIMDIKGAITQYYIERNEYPPDTADWQDLGDLSDARSLHRYLGRAIEDARGRRFGPYLNVKLDRVRDIQDGVGIYTDPWHNAFHMDAVHTRIVNKTPMGVGAPYREDTSVPKDQRTLGCKIVSFGPDGEASLYYYYPFDPDLSQPIVAKMAADDICSW